MAPWLLVGARQSRCQHAFELAHRPTERMALVMLCKVLGHDGKCLDLVPGMQLRDVHADVQSIWACKLKP